MTLDMWQSFFGWSLVINYLILVFWSLMVLYARDFVYRLHTYFIPISDEAFNNMHYGGMGLYKLLIFVFNLVPYLALLIIT